MKESVMLIGGLGYLGCELQKKFEQTGSEVAIIDNNLFGKWKEEEIIEMSDTVWVEDFTALTDTDLQNVSQHDRMVVLCYPDNRSELSELEEYFVKIDTSIKKLLEWGNSVDIVVSIEESEKYVSTFADYGNLCEVIGVPQTYGINQSFRSDLLIHDIVLQMLSQKSYLMEDDPFDLITFDKLENVVTNIFDQTGTTPAYHPPSLPLMNLCHIVQSMFGSEYGVHIRETGRGQTFYEDTTLRFCEEHFQDLTYFVTRMQKDWQSGMAEQLFEKCFYNNNTWKNMAVAYGNFGKIKI